MTTELKNRLLELWEETFGESDEEAGLIVIEEGDWIEDGKYSHRNSIVSFEGKFFDIAESRTGSYHTDYFYDDPEAYEVAPHTETITRTVYKRVA